jgi:hypothetical protein
MGRYLLFVVFCWLPVVWSDIIGQDTLIPVAPAGSSSQPPARFGDFLLSITPPQDDLLGVTDDATFHETAFFGLRTVEESTPFFAMRTQSTGTAAPSTERFFYHVRRRLGRCFVFNRQFFNTDFESGVRLVCFAQHPFS